MVPVGSGVWHYLVVPYASGGDLTERREVRLSDWAEMHVGGLSAVARAGVFVFWTASGVRTNEAKQKIVHPYIRYTRFSILFRFTKVVDFHDKNHSVEYGYRYLMHESSCG